MIKQWWGKKNIVHIYGGGGGFRWVGLNPSQLFFFKVPYDLLCIKSICKGFQQLWIQTIKLIKQECIINSDPQSTSVVFAPNVWRSTFQKDRGKNRKYPTKPAICYRYLDSSNDGPLRPSQHQSLAKLQEPIDKNLHDHDVSNPHTQYKHRVQHHVQ